MLLGTFGSLRWGELAALRRKDIRLAAATVRVERQLTEHQTAQQRRSRSWPFSAPQPQLTPASAVNA